MSARRNELVDLPGEIKAETERAVSSTTAVKPFGYLYHR
jgi:hypothetical protein